jgi:hypothetical protein
MTDIDLVIPMVFPQDAEWQREYRRYKDNEPAGHVRYRSWGTEELLVRCCMKYMPWVRFIHLLLASESQVQPWMETMQKCKNEKIKIVYHREFIPEQYLPCFASPCIEMFLHRIPGLSECFIYGNDDMFPLSPLEPTDFFRRPTQIHPLTPPCMEGSDYQQPAELSTPSHTGEGRGGVFLPCQHITERAYPANPGLFQRKCMWQQNMVAEPFGLHFTRTYPDTGHIFSAILKSSCEEVWRRHGDEITRNLSPLTRTDRSANNWVYQLYQQYSGRYVDHRPTRHYTDQNTSTQRLVEIIRDPQAGIVCINDHECIRDWERRAAIVRREIAAKLGCGDGIATQRTKNENDNDNGNEDDMKKGKSDEVIDVLIVHYNTPKLTAAAIRSLWLHTPGARVTVLDNSDRRPFRPTPLPLPLMEESDYRQSAKLSTPSHIGEGWGGVSYIDNTRGQVFDWERMLEQWPDKLPTKNNWGSAMHCYSVEVCMDRFKDGFVLMDSDVLVRRDIRELVDRSVAWKAGVQHRKKENSGLVERVEPYLCWINTPMLKEHGIRYFNPEKMWHLTSEAPGKNYDTGAWLKEACDAAGLPGLEIDLTQWIEHYGNGSWRKLGTSPDGWLKQHRGLWWTCPDTKIFVCTHTDFEPVVHNPAYEVVDARQFNGDICENGLRGSFYSELITYKHIAERQDLPEYVGFCGYRKYFSFLDNVPDVPSLLGQYDAIVTRPVRVMPCVEKQYARCHNRADLDIVDGIIRREFHDLWPTWNRTMGQTEMYACNMFILRRDDFLALIKTVFEILDRYVEEVGTDIAARVHDYPEAYHIGRNATSTEFYQSRIGGYLGERIVNAIIRLRFPRRMHYDRLITQEAVACP